MIILQQPNEPYDLALPYGITVTVRPLTTVGLAAAQSAARRLLEAIETQARERKEAGLPAGGLPDLSDEAERDGLHHDLLIKELAARHVTAWRGVLANDGESEAPVTRENVVALMEIFPVGDRFYQEFTLRQVLLTAAKNASGPSAAGTSSPVVGPNTAKPAGNRGSRARAESKEGTGGPTPPPEATKADAAPTGPTPS